MSTAALRAALFPGLPVTLGWSAAGPEDPAAGLYPAEAALVSGAVRTRRVSFGLGRQAAHVALAAAGAEPGPLLWDAQRLPLWPAGLIGSIAHTGTLAVAVVARREPLRAVGVDLEPARDLEAALWPRILTAAENRWVDSAEPKERGLSALSAFCAKEAVYKAWFPIHRVLLEFQAVELVFASDGSFTAVVHGPASDRATVRGRAARLEGHVWASAWDVDG